MPASVETFLARASIPIIRQTLETERNEMKLSRLFVYPVKAAAGIELSEATVDAFGIEHDRRWLVVDPDGVAITQRDEPRLALLTPTVIGRGLQLDAAGLHTLLIDDAADGESRFVTVWDDDIAAVDLGATPAQWLSDFLHRPVRLVYMPDHTFRSVNALYSPEPRPVSFADAFPFLVLSQESMDELNRRLDQPLQIERFRPNLVIAGAAQPHAEDEWSRFQVGDLEFAGVKPCARCAVPTVDQRTAERGKEPSRTLATYRKRDGKIYFGQNAIHRGPGRISVGDIVQIIHDARADTPAQTTRSTAPRVARET
jgi:uncharacterized protein